LIVGIDAARHHERAAPFVPASARATTAPLMRAPVVYTSPTRKTRSGQHFSALANPSRADWLKPRTPGPPRSSARTGQLHSELDDDGAQRMWRGSTGRRDHNDTVSGRPDSYPFALFVEVPGEQSPNDVDVFRDERLALSKSALVTGQPLSKLGRLAVQRDQVQRRGGTSNSAATCLQFQHWSSSVRSLQVRHRQHVPGWPSTGGGTSCAVRLSDRSSSCGSSEPISVATPCAGL
jgi:hypothetical protein